jgi:hypothetical protein
VKISISLDEMRQRKLMVCTPMYEGLCHAGYTKGIVELALLCQRYGVGFELNYLTNQPNSNRARNILLDGFVQSDCTHLIMIDADVVFRGEDVITLLALQTPEGPYDMIGGAYPKKSLDWARVAAGAGIGLPLERIASPLALNLREPLTGDQLDKPVPVARLAAGFAMLRRATITDLIDAFPDRAYRPGTDERAAFAMREVAYALYDNSIDPETGEYTSGDYAFCDRIIDVGMTIWLCPWIELGHVGNYQFRGSVSALAQLSQISPSQH